MNHFLTKLSPASRIFQFNIAPRSISLSAIHRVKNIQVKSENGTLTVAGQIMEQPKFDLLVQQHPANPHSVCSKGGNTLFCPECTLGLDIKHTDVLILSQYVRSDGCMLPRRITGLCKRQQKRIGTMVTMAQKAGLMPNLAPANSKRDPKKRFEWKKYNKYFDEKTIRW